MGDIVSRLEDHVTSAKQKTIPVIDFEKNESLKGLDYLDTIYHAIINKQVLRLRYRSFKAGSASTFSLHPYLLKEYRNRWFVFGNRKGSLVNLALDRIHHIEIAEKERFIENNLFDPQSFFDDLVGVTKNVGMKAETVRFWADKQNAPYILTKPIHKSQKLIETRGDGSMVFEIHVVINQELQREFFGFVDSIEILAPESLVDFMRWKYGLAKGRYERE